MLYLCKQKQEHKGGPGATGPAAGRAGVLTYRCRSPQGRGLKGSKGDPRAWARECHPHNAKRNRLNANSPPSGTQAGTLAGPRPAEGSNINQKIRKS